MNRRRAFLASMMGLVTASCIAGERRRRMKFTLADVLQSLQSTSRLSDLQQAYHTQGWTHRFNFNDPSNEYISFQRDRREWKSGLFTITPPNLFDTIPVGTKLVFWGYSNGDAINPTGGNLIIAVDDNDNIIGWAYSNTISHHKEAIFWSDELVE